MAPRKAKLGVSKLVPARLQTSDILGSLPKQPRPSWEPNCAKITKSERAGRMTLRRQLKLQKVTKNTKFEVSSESKSSESGRRVGKKSKAN